VIQRTDGSIPKLLTFPPGTFRSSLTVVTGNDRNCTDIMRRLIWKWVLQQPVHVVRACNSLTINLPNHGFSCGLPNAANNLPVESRLVRRAPARRTFHVTGLSFEFVGPAIHAFPLPSNTISAAVLCHHSKQPVAFTIRTLRVFVNSRQRVWRVGSALKALKMTTHFMQRHTALQSRRSA